MSGGLPRAVRRLAISLLALCGGMATAHDTWFQPMPPTRGEVTLALGTGTRFPVYEVAVDTQYFTRSGCRVGSGGARPIGSARYNDDHTLLRVPATDAAALTCWVQLSAFDIELPPEKIEIYFKEIRPAAEVLAAWATLSARGIPFRERYVKSARIDGPESASLPTGNAMDVLRIAPAGALRAGSEAGFRVLREGQPLADFPVELVNARSPLGLWSRTDANGELRVRLTLPGRWLLRGTDLHVSPSDPERFASRFIAYTFEVLP